MKLIIDIDEYDYSTIVNDERYMPLDISVAIKNGTPIPDNAIVCDIEQIRSEIENMDEIPSRFGLPKVLKFEVLRIIDKYKAEKEGR